MAELTTQPQIKPNAYRRSMPQQKICNAKISQRKVTIIYLFLDFTCFISNVIQYRLVAMKVAVNSAQLVDRLIQQILYHKQIMRANRNRNRSRNHSRSHSHNQQNAVLLPLAAQELYLPDVVFRYQIHDEIQQSVISLLQDHENNSRIHYPAYNKTECLKMIDAGIGDMYDYNFDFYRSHQPELMELFSSAHTYALKKSQIYMRHHCLYCQDRQRRKNSRNQRVRRWTTTLGYFFLKFKLIPINVFNKKVKEWERIDCRGYKYSTPYMLIYSIQILRSKCQQCLEWGIPQIYKPCLELAIDQFCYYISTVLNQEQYQRPERLSKQRIPNLRNHRPSLCEACYKGICAYSFRSNRRRNQARRENDYQRANRP